MITVRRSSERGYADHGWLQTYHTFSFADYYNPQFMQFYSLRVLNEDRVKPGKGFPTHSHNNMEILSYVLEGTLEHKDSLGTGSLIKPGEIQRMTAGKGVLHSEFNPSSTEAVHFLQIWLYPNQKELEPSYEQKAFSLADRTNRLCLLASPNGQEGSVTIHQDAKVYGTVLEEGQEVTYSLSSSRAAWVQVANGTLLLQDQVLQAGDGATIENTSILTLRAQKTAEVLLFDLGISFR